ncbi:MAG: hypothetical protein HQL52_13270 [Magnetococcales bacterium]|nr:hypothetical protein [Magnetococcales bacterium]
MSDKNDLDPFFPGRASKSMQDKNLEKVLPKNELKVDVQLVTGRHIRGTLYVDLQTRLYDFMNLSQPWVVVVDKKNPKLTTIVNKSHIVSIREVERFDAAENLPHPSQKYR